MSWKQLSKGLRTAQIQEGMRCIKSTTAPWISVFEALAQVDNSDGIGQHLSGIKDRSRYDLLIREALQQLLDKAQLKELSRKQCLLIKEALSAFH